MDPNAALEAIRKLVEQALKHDLADYEVRELAELVQGLDEWLVAGGFLPKAWEENRYPELPAEQRATLDADHVEAIEDNREIDAAREPIERPARAGAAAR